LPEEKKGSPEDEEETLQRKNANPVPGALYALRPRRPSSGKGNNQLLKPHDNEKKILARSPLDKIPIAAAVSPRSRRFRWRRRPGRYNLLVVEAVVSIA
jgi:hypothetical protein